MSQRKPTESEEIVDAIIADLADRRGLRHEWQGIDEDIQLEIRAAWIAIVDSRKGKWGAKQ